MCKPFCTSIVHSSSQCFPRAISGRRSSVSPQTVAECTLRLHHPESRRSQGLAGALQGDALWSSVPTRLPVSVMPNSCSRCQPPPPPTHLPSALPPFPAQGLKMAGALAPAHPLIKARKKRRKGKPSKKSHQQLSQKSFRPTRATA